MSDEHFPMFAVLRGGKAKRQQGESAPEITFTPEAQAEPEADAERDDVAEQLRAKFEFFLQHCDNVVIVGVMEGQVLGWDALDNDELRVQGALVSASNSITLRGIVEAMSRS